MIILLIDLKLRFYACYLLDTRKQELSAGLYHSEMLFLANVMACRSWAYACIYSTINYDCAN